MNEKKIIKLSGFGWKAKISPLFGMNTFHLSYGNQAILRTPDTLDLVAAGTATYGISVLLPPNRTENAKFTFDGKCYCLPMNEPRYQNSIHGRLHRVHFRVLDKNATSVTATYLNIGEIFPFPFRITVHYYLDESGYHQEFTIENVGNIDMPLVFGLHTNFVSPETLQIPLDRKWPTNDRLIPNGQPMELTEQAQSFRTGSPTQGFPITGFFTSGGTTAQLDNVLYTVSDNFNQWLLWNGEGTKGFISVTPQCGAVNALNSGAGLIRLKPGQIETFTTWFHLS